MIYGTRISSIVVYVWKWPLTSLFVCLPLFCFLIYIRKLTDAIPSPCTPSLLMIIYSAKLLWNCLQQVGGLHKLKPHQNKNSKDRASSLHSDFTYFNLLQSRLPPVTNLWFSSKSLLSQEKLLYLNIIMYRLIIKS